MPSVSVIQALRTGIEHFTAGRLGEAEAICRQILSHDANNYDALHLLGAVAYRVANYPAAIELIGRAAQLRPDAAELWGNLASSCLASQRIEQAIAHADTALRLEPDNLQAHSVRGAAMFHAGRWDDALLAWQKTLPLTPNDSMLHSNIAVTLERLGRLDEAIAEAQRAIELDPNNAQAHDNMGAALTKLGRTAEGLECHLRAIALQPDFAIAFNNLAYCCYELGRLDEAESAARRGAELAPQDPVPLRTLSAILLEVGLIDEAAVAFERTISVMRAACDARAARGEDPAVERQRLTYTQLMATMMLPQIYDSSEEIDRWRNRLVEGIKKLRDENFVLQIDDEASPPVFPLAYQGRNDVDIQRDIASLIRAPQSPPPQQHRGGKMRVTFISRFLKNHTIGRLNAGLIEHLNRDEFEVGVVSIGRFDDPVANTIKQHAQQYATIPPSLRAARQIILQQRPDIIYFTDIGMEPISYSLAFSRLAPVQCVTWGHPLTTGIDTVDYFISSELLEIPEAQEHYTEQLVRLPSLAVCYERPTLPESRKTRADFGLDEEAHIYGCLQSVWKLHPEFDPLLAEILRRDPRGRLLLLETNTRRWQEKLKQRFARTLGDAASRIQFIPQQKREDFLALTSLCDVLLDPIHFGGGNTSYEAFAFGVPVVTLPSPLLRGRITAALYSMMGVDDCVATSPQDYVSRAAAIGMDRERRRAVSEKILASNAVIYDNLDGVRQLETFFKQAVEQRRGS